MEAVAVLKFDGTSEFASACRKFEQIAFAIRRIDSGHPHSTGVEIDALDMMCCGLQFEDADESKILDRSGQARRYCDRNHFPLVLHHIDTYPTLAVIDRRSIVAAYRIGALSESELRAAIENRLAGAT